jgi:hypothetical protein
MSPSWAELLRAYLATRFPLRLFLPVAALLAAPSLADEPWPGGGLAASRVAVALLLVLQFRLWDDLSDVERDRLDDPGRVLCRTPSLAPFRAALTAAALASAAALIALRRAVAPALVLAAIDAAFVAWYGWARSRVGSPVARALVPLVKYPALAFLLHPASPSGAPPRLVASVVLILASFVLFELVHDDVLARDPVGHRARAIALVAFSSAGLLPLLLEAAAPSGAAVPFLRAAPAVVGTMVLARLLGRSLPASSAARRSRGYLAFVICAAVGVPLWLGGAP